MPSPSCPQPPRRSRRRRAIPLSSEAWPATLERLAAVLSDGARQGTCALVGLAATADDSVDLHLLPVPPADLTTELTGWRAPVSWRAAGVVSPTVVPEAPAQAGSATAVLARPNGALVVGVAGFGPARSWTIPAGAGEGRLADLCRRSMGAATPGCAESPRYAWAAPWLDRLVGVAAGRARHAGPVRWPEVAVAHSFVSGVTAPAAPPSPDDLVRLATHPLARSTWEGLRRASARGRWAAGDLSADESAWLDAGSFARRLLARHPPPGELLGALSDLLSPALFDQVATVAAAWDVRPGRPGDPTGPETPR